MSVAVDIAAPRITAHRKRLITRVWRTGNGRVGFVIMTLIAAITIASLLGVTPFEPTEQHASDRFASPSWTYLLGTDQFGRDVASRIMAGIAASLRVSLVAVLIAATVGTLAGMAAGFFGGWTDRVIGRVTDILFAFPAILLALAIVSALGRGWFNTALAIAVVYTPIFMRVARAPVLAVREMDYVRAGRVLGFGSRRLLFRHVLPNVTAPIIVQIALALSWAILTESALSFLGLGTQPPEPSLGLMVSEGRTLVAEGWWLLLPPSLAIVVAVIGLNLLGDGLRDALDPTRSTS
jgi:peptide/nickel transport system permease protein